MVSPVPTQDHVQHVQAVQQQGVCGVNMTRTVVQKHVKARQRGIAAIRFASQMKLRVVAPLIAAQQEDLFVLMGRIMIATGLLIIHPTLGVIARRI